MNTTTLEPATKLIGGEVWTEIAPGSNRWQGPDADPTEHRTHANGYGGSDIIRTPDGFALRAGKLSPRTAWRPASTPLTPKLRDTRSILADPARRADWLAERAAENRARAYVIAARRAQAIAEDTAGRFVAKYGDADALALAESLDIDPVALAADERIALADVPVPHVSVSPSGRRKVWHRLTHPMVVMSEINRDWRIAIADQDFAVSRAEYHKGRARVMFSPVERAAKASREASRRARIVASETPDERAARLAKNAERARRNRAARLAAPGKLTAADATL